MVDKDEDPHQVNFSRCINLLAKSDIVYDAWQFRPSEVHRFSFKSKRAKMMLPPKRPNYNLKA